MDHTVIFAGNDTQKAIMSGQFPDIALHTLSGYEVNYGRSALMLQLLRQVPGLLHRIREEHRWLADFVEQQQIDAIISDNRYGLWHPKKATVILTHQLNILTGLGRLADARLRKIHYSYLQRFGNIWIPDLPGQENFGGLLSHPQKMPPNTHYIGCLSQLESVGSIGNKSHLLILLSGPEPQRSILSEKLWQQALTLEMPIVFVEGKAGISREAPAHIQHLSFANAQQVGAFLKEAMLVVCRSGYSTIMDLVKLGKPAILIPTPGQTEQTYLAQSLSANSLFYTARQRDINLKAMVALAMARPRPIPAQFQYKNTLLESVLQDWLTRF